MKKIFGGINLTWKRLIIFSVIAASYTAIMALLPFTMDTSFRDIAVYFEWWILFGIIIITNSKSPLDSGLKSFVFFLISQPLIYLIQVPFTEMGWGLFGYYKYWFIWTLACFPMGYIGYYIKKKNIISLLILLPIFALLAYLGIGYLSAVIENFPHHLLSCIFCFSLIIIVTFNIFDNIKLRLLSILLVLIGTLGFVFIGKGLKEEFETYYTLEQFNIPLSGEINIYMFSGTENGNAEVVLNEPPYSLRLKGVHGGKYTLSISDEDNNIYDFEYHYDEKSKSVVLSRKDDK